MCYDSRGRWNENILWREDNGGKTMFALTYYDGRSVAAEVSIQTIPIWIEVFGLPPYLFTKEGLYMVGVTFGKILNHDHPNMMSGARA